MKFLRKTMVACLTVLLAGCGGGGGGSDGTSGDFAQAPAGIEGQGVYQGTVSYGIPTQEYTQILLVLEDGTYYSMYGTPASGTLYASHLIQGTGTINSSGTFTSTDLKHFVADGSVMSGSLSVPNISTSPFIGEITENGSPELFQGDVPATANYVYSQPPVYANLVGASWSLTDLTGAATTVDFAADNTYTGTTGGCSFSGTIAPRVSGKNVFDVKLTFGAAPCALPGQTVTGIAINYVLTNGKRQLIIAGVDASRSHAVAFFGAR